MLKISYNSKPDKYNVPLINAGITKWNLRPRKILNEKYLQTINIEKEAPKVSHFKHQKNNQNINILLI